MTQYQNEEKEKEDDELQIIDTNTATKPPQGPHENLIVSITEEKKKDGHKTDKLNLLDTSIIPQG